MEAGHGGESGSRAIHLRVAGRVQGVGFRYFIVSRAEQLGLVGYARNLPDGDVEVWAEGAPEALEALREAAALGPRSAHVESVSVQEAGPTGSFHCFGVRS